MTRRPMLLGAEVFPTKEAAAERVRAILYGHPPGAPIAGGHFDLLRALLELHPDARRKIGRGVARFEVRPNPLYPGNRGFWLVRVDGTETDWSFTKCLHPHTHRDDVRHALRIAVIDHVYAVKAAAFHAGLIPLCTVTGEPVSEEDAHVDHAPPSFLELADRFADLCGGYDRIRVTPGADGTICRRLADPPLVQSWRDFHRAQARLRIVSKRANLSLLRRGTGRGGEWGPPEGGQAAC